MTFGVALVAQPAQKASAQSVLSGSGSTAVEPLIDNWFTNRGASYDANDDDEGRDRFNEGLTDFVSTDFFLPNVPGQVVTNPIDSTIALPYNVPGLPNLRLNKEQACGIINGTITNWSEVGGPDLLVRRVFRSDVSSDTAAFNNGFVQPVCGFPISTPDGAITVPNPSDNDIAASTNPDVVTAVASNPGAIGYIEEFVARSAGFNESSFAFFSDRASDFPDGFRVAGPNYVVFRGSYDTEEKATAARDLCRYIATDGSSEAVQQLGYAAPSNPRPASDCDAITGPAGEQ